MTKNLDGAVNPLGSNNIQAFLSTVWQKKPLLIAEAYPNFTPLIGAEELAELACEEVEVPIVIQDLNNDRWQVRHGSFEESAFSSLPKSHWAL